MPLESLLTLVEKLRERIDVHGPALRQNEMQTRYALIDPLLRELGWDTGDPKLVIPEYKTEDGSADYALLSDGKPIMMVEAKKLDTPLRDRVLTQGLTYCQMQGTRYCSVTDGGRWEIYDTHNTGPKDEKRIVEFDLKSRSPAETSLKALALWRPNLDSDRVGPRQAPVVEPPKSPIPNPQPPSPGLDEHEWRPISEWKPTPYAPPPVEVRFPDNSAGPVTTWKALLAEVVRWLVNGNHLKPSHCPIRETPRSRKYIVHTEPVHETGKQFKSPIQVGSLYVRTFGGIGTANAAPIIIEHVGQDPAQFKVRFSPPSTKPAPS